MSSFRMLLVGAAVAGALAITSVAAAAVHPALIVSNLDPVIAEQEVIVAMSPADSPVAKTTIYVGAGDVMTLRPKLPFGEVDADFKSSADYGSSFFSLIGDVINVSPVSYKNNDCAPGVHAAVWLARLSPEFLDVTIPVPIYVDPAPQSEKSYASYVLTTCMPSPYDAFPAGAIFGGKLVDLQLYLGNFQTAVDNRWTTVATPFKSGGGADPQASAEAQSVVTQGSISTLKVKRIAKPRHGKKHKKRYFARVSGRVTAGGAGIPASIEIYQLFNNNDGPHVASVKADDSGFFSTTVRQKRTASYGVVAQQLGTDVTPAVCNPVLDVGFGPLSCSSVLSSDFVSARISARVHIPKGGKGPSPRASQRFLHRLRGRFTR